MEHEPPATGELPAGARQRELPLRFIGSGSEYFRIWIVNLLLTLVTLGLYYPFAKVRRLKYFHGATELAGQPFGFHADPWKMLRGYLLVVVMMVLYGVAEQVSPISGLVALAIVGALWPALWHSSLRFRFANTSWRGLRFHFRGSRGGAYKVYGWVALAIGGLVVVGVGFGMLGALGSRGEPADGQAGGALAAIVLVLAMLALYVVGGPAFLWLMHRYRQQHLALGSEHAAWSVRVPAYIKLVLKTMLVSAVPLAALGTLATVLLPSMAQGGGSNPGFGVVVAGVVVYVLFIAIAGGYFTARLQDLMWNGTASANIAFHSALSARRTMALSARNWLLTIVTLGLYHPFARVAMARLRLEAVNVRLALPLDALCARLERGDESAAGDAAGDLLGWDIGL